MAEEIRKINGYTLKDEVARENLATKSDIDHNHDDLYATKEDLLNTINELKSLVNTLSTRVLNLESILEYTIDSSSDEIIDSNRSLYFPNLFIITGSARRPINGEITIFLNDGSKTEDCNVPASSVKSIRIALKKNIIGVSFKDVKITNIITIDSSNLKSFESMFEDCSQLTNLNLTSWDIEHIKNTKKMFKGCTGLTSLILSNWDTREIENSEDMFLGLDSNINWGYREGVNYTNFTLKKTDTGFSGTLPWE